MRAASGVTLGGTAVFNCAGQVLACLTFNVSSSAPSSTQSALVTGLPRPSVETYAVACNAAGQNQRVYLDVNGALRLDGSRVGTGWFTCNFPYVAAS